MNTKQTVTRYQVCYKDRDGQQCVDTLCRKHFNASCYPRINVTNLRSFESTLRNDGEAAHACDACPET